MGIGTAAGSFASKRERAVVRLVNLYTDAAPAPRAWDYLRYLDFYDA